jgi:hypothetical protein
VKVLAGKDSRVSWLFEPRDWWVGFYFAHGAVYITIIPCLPVRVRTSEGTA